MGNLCVSILDLLRRFSSCDINYEMDGKNLEKTIEDVVCSYSVAEAL